MNYQSFGWYIKELRTKLGVSRIDVSKSTGLSQETIRRVEEGIPEVRCTTLEILSHYYKVNLIKEMSYYFDNTSIISSDIMVEISNSLTELDFEKLNEHFELFRTYSGNGATSGGAFEYTINSLKSAISKLSATKANDAKLVIIQLEDILLKSSIHTKTLLGDLKLFEFEFIIASTLVTFYRRCNENLKAIDLCLLAIEKLLNEPRNDYMNNRLISTFYFNLCYSYHILDKHEEVLKVSDTVLKNNKILMNQNQIAGIHYRRAVAQFSLNDQSYYDTLTTALLLSSETMKKQMITSTLKLGVEHHLLKK